MSDFQKFPFIEIKTRSKVYKGWSEINSQIISAASKIIKEKKIIIVECYQGTFEKEIIWELSKGIKPDLLIISENLYLDENKIKEMIYPDVTDDRIFGYITRLEIGAYFNPDKINEAREKISSIKQGIILIAGTGAAIIPQVYDLLIYADMARWEIQLRMRKS